MPPTPRRRLGTYAQPKPIVTRADAARRTPAHLCDVIEWQGLRRPWVAQQMGYDVSWLSCVLNGKRPLSETFITRACILFRLPPDVLFPRRPTPTPTPAPEYETQAAD